MIHSNALLFAILEESLILLLCLEGFPFPIAISLTIFKLALVVLNAIFEKQTLPITKVIDISTFEETSVFELDAFPISDSVFEGTVEFPSLSGVEPNPMRLTIFPLPHEILKSRMLVLPMIYPDHSSFSISLAIYKIANIKIPFLINLYPNPIPLIQHQLTFVNLSLRADYDTFAVTLAIDDSTDVKFVLVDGYPRAAVVFQVGKGSGVAF